MHIYQRFTVIPFFTLAILALAGCGGSGSTSQPVKLVAEVFSKTSEHLLIRLACAGSGIVAVPDQFALPHVRAGELQRVLPDWCLPSATAWAVFPGRRLMPTKTRAFIDMLQQALADK